MVSHDYPNNNACAGALCRRVGAWSGSDMGGSWLSRLKVVVRGKPRDLNDQKTYHKLSLIAFFAWVGLGADGLSSSCYGPEETFLVLRDHPHLAVFIALAAALTVLIISASYSQ